MTLLLHQQKLSAWVVQVYVAFWMKWLTLRIWWANILPHLWLFWAQNFHQRRMVLQQMASQRKRLMIWTCLGQIFHGLHLRSSVLGLSLGLSAYPVKLTTLHFAAMAGDAFSLATGNCSLNFVLGVGDLTSTTKSFGDEAAEVLEDFSLLIIGVVKFTGPSSIKPPADFPPCPQESSCRFAVVLLTNG